MVNAATFHEMSPTMAVHSSDNARSFLQNRGLKTNRPEQVGTLDGKSFFYPIRMNF